MIDLQLKPAASRGSAGLGHLAAVCWPLVLCVHAGAREASGGGVRALAREIFPATQLKKRFRTKKHRQRAVRVTGFVGKIAT
jgi:hypothetical protein